MTDEINVHFLFFEKSTREVVSGFGVCAGGVKSWDVPLVTTSDVAAAAEEQAHRPDSRLRASLLLVPRRVTEGARAELLSGTATGVDGSRITDEDGHRVTEWRNGMSRAVLCLDCGDGEHWTIQLEVY